MRINYLITFSILESTVPLFLSKGEKQKYLIKLSNALKLANSKAKI